MLKEITHYAHSYLLQLAFYIARLQCTVSRVHDCVCASIVHFIIIAKACWQVNLVHLRSTQQVNGMVHYTF